MQKNYVSENDTLFLVFSTEESASSGEMANGIIADFARRKDHLELKLRLQRLDQIKPLVAEARNLESSQGEIQLMDEQKKDISERIIIEGILIDNALKRAMRKAAIMHKKMGNTVYASKAGIVYAIPPEEIVIPEAPSE